MMYADCTIVHYHAAGKDLQSETRTMMMKRASGDNAFFIDGNNQSRTAGSGGGSLAVRSYPNDQRIGSIGRNTSFQNDGRIYETILFDSALSTTDLNNWNDYVEAKYNTGSGAMETPTDF